MKKLKKPLFLIAFLISGLSFFAFNYRTSLVEQLISKHLNNVPVYLEELKLSKKKIKINDFFIGNFSKAKIPYSFCAKEISINSDLAKLTDELFIIDSVEFKDITLAIEYYNKTGSNNNWISILKELKPKLSIKKNYCIKKISLENLKVQVTDYTGKLISYPIIDNLEFYNIWDSPNSPINKIDLTVLKIVTKAIFKRIGLSDFLKKENTEPVILPHFKIKKTREFNPRAHKL